MKGYFKTIGCLLVAFLIESILLRWPIFEHLQPNLLLIVLVTAAFRYGPIVGVFSGFSLGIVQDVYVVEFLGANAFVKGLIGYSIGIFDASRFTLTYTSKTVLLWVSVFLHDVLYGMCTGSSLGSSMLFFLQGGVVASLVTTLLGVVLFYILEYRDATSRS